MNQSIRMLMNNLADSATIEVVVGEQVTELPVEMMQRYENSEAFRVIGTQLIFTISYPDFVKSNALVMYRHNLSNTATMRVEHFDEPEAQGSLVYDSGVMDAIPTKSFSEWQYGDDTFVASPFDTWEFRYSQAWMPNTLHQSTRVTINDPQNTDGFIDITRLYSGFYISPEITLSEQHDLTWLTQSEHYRTAGKSLHTSESGRVRALEFNLSHVSDAERPFFSEALRFVGMDKDWFVSVFPERGGQLEIEYSFACKWTALPSIKHLFYNNWQLNCALEEC